MPGSNPQTGPARSPNYTPENLQSSNFSNGVRPDPKTLPVTNNLDEFVDAVMKSAIAINRKALGSDNPQLRKDWGEHYANIEGNLDYIRQKSKEGRLDQKLANELLKGTLRELVNWNERLNNTGKENLPAVRHPGNAATNRLPSFLPETRNLQQPVVVMDYRDAIALEYFKQFGIPLLQSMWPDIDSMLHELGNPNSKTRKEGGIGIKIRNKLMENAPKENLYERYRQKP